MTEAKTISEAELDVLKSLWEVGPAPVRKIREHLESRGRSWYRAGRPVLDGPPPGERPDHRGGQRPARHAFRARADRPRAVK